MGVGPRGARARSVRYLLDTHALLWWLFDDARISPRARALIADRSNTFLVSSASAWEIATKWRIGKLPAASTLVRDIPGWIAKAGFGELAVNTAHAQRAGTWPAPHRDPFDRLLAAQSHLEDAPLVSLDEQLDAFGIRRVW